MSRRVAVSYRTRRCVPAFLVGLVITVASGCAINPGPLTGPTPVAAMPPLPASPVPPTMHLTGNEISIEFVPDSERALEDTQTEWRAEEPTLGQLPGWTDGHDTVHLPITDGDVALAATPPRGRVVTAGAPMLSRSGTSITFRDLVVDLDGAHVTGTVDGHPLDVFDLDLSRAHVEDPSTLAPMVVDVSGRLSPDAVREVADHLGPGLTADNTSVDIEMRLKSS